MTENKSATFEVALKRLEEIVHQLENDAVSLDRSVELFQEGRDLARRCEALLKTAQETIDAAASATAPEPKAAGVAPSGGPAPFAERSDDELSF